MMRPLARLLAAGAGVASGVAGAAGAAAAWTLFGGGVAGAVKFAAGAVERGARAVVARARGQ